VDFQDSKKIMILHVLFSTIQRIDNDTNIELHKVYIKVLVDVLSDER
jgi:hypothetical protein